MSKNSSIKPKKQSPPTQFTHDGQIWRIRYLDEKPNDNLGETHLNINEIRIWVKGIPLDCIQETLQHEILHVVLRDCMVILNESNASPHDLEEAIIRLTSPRLFAIMSQNPKLREFIYGK
jgi:hypothetical protein